jgi:hypothetical protein
MDYRAGVACLQIPFYEDVEAESAAKPFAETTLRLSYLLR